MTAGLCLARRMEFAPADAASPDHIDYLDGVAATTGARTYKDRLHAALGFGSVRHIFS